MVLAFQQLARGRAYWNGSNSGLLGRGLHEMAVNMACMVWRTLVAH